MSRPRWVLILLGVVVAAAVVAVAVAMTRSGGRARRAPAQARAGRTTGPTTFTTEVSEDPVLRSGQPGTGRAAGVAHDTKPVPLRPAIQCRSTGPPRATTTASADERDGKRWVTVGHLAGNCDATSAPFRLRGIDTRLVVRSDASELAVFLVDTKQGLDATAGFADAECSQPCSEIDTLTIGAAEYQIRVQAADAPWDIAVEEYRTP